ncbi:fasciclin-like arabinogalactan protein 4-like, partial [Trifolium pratense]
AAHRGPSVNIMEKLTADNHFHIAVGMIIGPGIDSDLKDVQHTGVTLFMPENAAYGKLSNSRYYNLHTLQSAKIPSQMTLASEDKKAPSFLLNISSINGSVVVISTGVVEAVITRTVFDHYPVVIYAVSKVLLPKELFGTIPDDDAPPPRCV